ncbi:ABC transporter ATP-binding protein/permease [Poseidonocella sp. HB161398]|uniref:ABC transporter ATP-binding protein/permease n=1 Tax=Poseidonocella sp. HB161398 TaxID=2320855 RepID=UPI001F1161B5|nr:ATP-binding cassette domain-containing protein [Poseidonocella sp. HB161398]
MSPADPILTRLTRASAQGLRRAGLWRLGAELLWPVQAACLALAIGGWVAEAPPERSALLALGFLAAGLMRSLAERRAARLAAETAERAVAALRRELLAEEAARLDRGLSSGAFAALLVQKLPSLRRYLARYRPARMRVSAVAPVLLLLSLWCSWAVALILAVAGPLIPVFMALVGMAAKEASERQMGEIGSLNTLLTDRLAMLPDIRLLDAGERTARDFGQSADRLRARTMEVLRIAFLSSTVLELFSAIGVAMVAVYVGFSLLGELGFGAWATPLTLEEGIFVLLLAPSFFQPLRDLAAAWHDQAEAKAVGGEIDALLAGAAAPLPGGVAEAPALPGAATLSFRDVRLSRGGREIAVPDFDAAPGELVVLTGPSGRGKSTALMAAMGLLSAASGRIEAAGLGLDVATAPGWRARLAWLPQAIHVPDQSLAAFLDPRHRGGDLQAALSRAGAGEVVARLPGGLAARLGETGAGLSGGEARRLLLARAVAMEADAVLADEPTADLDAATAEIVIATLKSLAAEGRLVLAASHDPALIAAADREVAL